MYKHVWEDYQRLSSSRPAGFGVSPISYTEINSYFSLMGIVPEIWEVEAIKIFDSITLSEYSKQQEKNNKNKTSE